MNTKDHVVRQPMPRATIFKVLLCTTYSVSGIFLLKNVFTGNLSAIVAIAACILLFTAILLWMRATKRELGQQQYVTALAILFLIFIISLYSGDFYSDDFGLYITVIGVTGLYLQPLYTRTQIILADILLALQYIIHPEKADPLSQYIMCMVIFTLGGIMFYLAINRGRTYIEIGEARAEDAEQLLSSLQQLGQELNRNVENSTNSIETLKAANERLGHNAEELRRGSSSITQGARSVSEACEDVQQTMTQTEQQVDTLTGNVQDFEQSLNLNRRNMQEMSQQMQSVQSTMSQANEVFRIMETQMKEITAVTEQLNSITSSTTMLALNASIEAARAGQSGAGFAVVASKVQELAVDSTKCSGQVAEVVSSMQTQIKETTKQLAESSQAIFASLSALQELQDGFDHLTDGFSSLYRNIEAQNGNITQVNSIFEQLKNSVAEMSRCSADNQETVSDIAEAMGVYQVNMDIMMEDTRHVHELSSNLLQVAQQDSLCK